MRRVCTSPSSSLYVTSRQFSPLLGTTMATSSFRSEMPISASAQSSTTPSVQAGNRVERHHTEPAAVAFEGFENVPLVTVHGLEEPCTVGEKTAVFRPHCERHFLARCSLSPRLVSAR